MNTLTNKVAIITGGASGIGRATAVLFAQEGAAVAIIDINTEQGQSTVAEITSRGGKAIFIPGNVANADDCHAAVEKTVATFGRLDVLFNNAGIVRRATSSIPPEDGRIK
jgi:NAD(P)-dependent dehydrogenase (short-subunit alcohol dehydrogenase family)